MLVSVLCFAGIAEGLSADPAAGVPDFQPPRTGTVPDLPQALLGLADTGEPGHSLRKRAENGPLERPDPLHGLPSDRRLRGNPDLHGGMAGPRRIAQVLSRSGSENDRTVLAEQQNKPGEPLKRPIRLYLCNERGIRSCYGTGATAEN